MTPSRAFLLAASLAPLPAAAQQPYRHFTEAVAARAAVAHPVLHYRFRVEGGDTTRVMVELAIRNAPDTLRLALAKHPEYDDRYWRQVRDVTAQSAGANVPVVREDSGVWRVPRHGRDLVVRYVIALAPRDAPRAAWRPFLTPTGGLIAGPHMTMYPVGAELAPAHVSLALPAGWRAASGLEPTSDSTTWFAPTIDRMVDSPFLIGRLRERRFAVDGVPHRVVMWPSPTGRAFDTTAFVGGLEAVAKEAVALFGRAPWREYTFLYMDDAYGGLEHANSVTLGMFSDRLAADPRDHLEESTHEFFHAWNLMRIRPIEYRGLSHRPQALSRGLWFSEGLTILYSDLLLRRAGFPAEGATRADHLAWLITRQGNLPGNARFSAETISRAEYAETDLVDGYTVSSHLLGEILGNLLDLRVRSATGGRRTIDDVMRAMNARFGGTEGFTSAGVERVVEEVCGCDVTPLFDAHVRGAGPIAYDRHLAPFGLRAVAERRPALDREGRPAPDRRVRPADIVADEPLRLVMPHPESAWQRAGLRTGDTLVAIDGKAMPDWPAFRGALSGADLGDTLRVAVRRAGKALTIAVVITSYDEPVTRIEEIPGATAAQRKLREEWLKGGN